MQDEVTLAGVPQVPISYYKRGMRVIVNLGTAKVPEHRLGTVKGVDNGMVTVLLDNNATYKFLPTRSLVGLLGMSYHLEPYKGVISKHQVKSWMSPKYGKRFKPNSVEDKPKPKQSVERVVQPRVKVNRTKQRKHLVKESDLPSPRQPRVKVNRTKQPKPTPKPNKEPRPVLPTPVRKDAVGIKFVTKLANRVRDGFIKGEEALIDNDDFFAANPTLKDAFITLLDADTRYDDTLLKPHLRKGGSGIPEGEDPESFKKARDERLKKLLKEDDNSYLEDSYSDEDLGLTNHDFF